MHVVVKHSLQATVHHFLNLGGREASGCSMLVGGEHRRPERTVLGLSPEWGVLGRRRGHVEVRLRRNESR